MQTLTAKAKNIIGQPLYYYKTIDSTNSKATELAEKGAMEGTIVQADQQTAGKGRLQRKWESPAGRGLWFSLILRPKIDPQYGAQATLLTAVALVEALKNSTGITCQIKWPNDILIKGKKLAGILSEMRLSGEQIDYIVIGIGLNVDLGREDFGEILSTIASSVYLETGKQCNREKILEAILKSMGKWYNIWQETGFERVRERWLASNCTIGRVVKVKDQDKELFSGLAIDIDDYGCLLVKSRDGITKKFDFGEISIRN
ncbi:MAG: biotin--[acetyl-CoA-carboxylase] ligase [Acidaminococcaceae bacterium]